MANCLVTEGNAFGPSGTWTVHLLYQLQQNSFTVVKSYSQVQQHLLNLVDNFNNTPLFIPWSVSTAKTMQCQTLVQFMNQGL